MKAFLRAARTACLFIGSVIGAGFATGQEVAVFFGGGSLWNLPIAAAFMGASAFFFLEIGASKIEIDLRVKAGTDTVVALCSFVIYAAMIASAESVLQRRFGINGLSLLVVLLCSMLSAKSVTHILRLNLAAVPALIAIVIFVGSKTPVMPAGSALRPLSAIAYGAMNMLFSGALMIREGKSLSKKERVIASVISGGLFYVALFFMFRAIGSAPYPEMPFLAAAEAVGLGSVAPVGLLIAILTTMVGCDYLVTDRLNSVLHDPVLSASLVALFGIVLSIVGFVPIVQTAYPVVSYLGVAFSLIAPFYVKFAPRILKERFGKKQVGGKC